MLTGEHTRVRQVWGTPVVECGADACSSAGAAAWGLVCSQAGSAWGWVRPAACRVGRGAVLFVEDRWTHVCRALEDRWTCAFQGLADGWTHVSAWLVDVRDNEGLALWDDFRTAGCPLTPNAPPRLHKFCP